MFFYANIYKKIHSRQPVYDIKENSFYYKPWGKCDVSLMLNSFYVGLDIDFNTMTAVQLSGICPYKKWIHKNIIPPTANPGNLIVQNINKDITGVGYEYSDILSQVLYNKRSGWICIGEENYINMDCVEFEKDTIAVVDNGRLIAIWIKPIFD